MQLAGDMIECLYEDFPNTWLGDDCWHLWRRMPWSFGPGDVPSHVYNFLRVLDCFRHSADGAHVSYSFTHLYIHGTLVINATPKWQVPRVLFPGLPVRLPTGYMYQIKPHLDKAKLGSLWCANFDMFEDTIEYKISSPDIRFKSNQSRDGFEAYLPSHLEVFLQQCRPRQSQSADSEQGGPKRIRSTVRITIITQFPNGVRFKRDIRYRINLVVYNQEEGKIPGKQVDHRSWYPVLSG